MQLRRSSRLILFVAMALIILLSGCAGTTYQAKGISGGYSEIQIDASTWRVTFEGNGFSERAEVEAFLIYRCAELAISKGFDWFLVTEREGDSEWHPKYGKISVVSTAVIKMSIGTQPPGLLRSYEARSVINSMSSKIRR